MPALHERLLAFRRWFRGEPDAATLDKLERLRLMLAEERDLMRRDADEADRVVKR